MFNRELSHLISMVVVSILMISNQSSADDESIKFFSDYNTAIKEAKASGRPIFLEFRCAP